STSSTACARSSTSTSPTARRSVPASAPCLRPDPKTSRPSTARSTRSGAPPPRTITWPRRWPNPRSQSTRHRPTNPPTARRWRSMDLYIRFLLHFLFALQSSFSRVETFTFSVRLTRVTDYLRARSYREVLRRLTAVKDWSGGTRIGESLAEFNRGWPSLVDRRTIVIILSDGWDTGDPDVLAAELLRIKRRAGRVIWL